MAPESLHPALWRGHQLGRSVDHGLPTGYPALDAQLPGGGWPRRALSELLLPQMGIGELRLLAPALASVQRAGRLVMLFDPPAALSGWALAQLGLDVEQLLLIQSARQVPVEPGRAPGGLVRPVGVQSRLWALEQALKSGHVGAVLAWLPPRLSPDRVRRLQLAAHAHDGPAFVLRELAAQPQPSASPLRLGLRAAGVDQLAVRVLKRRGPPLLQPVHLRLPSMVPASVAHRAQHLGSFGDAQHLGSFGAGTVDPTAGRADRRGGDGTPADLRPVGTEHGVGMGAGAGVGEGVGMGMGAGAGALSGVGLATAATPSATATASAMPPRLPSATFVNLA